MRMRALCDADRAALAVDDVSAVLFGRWRIRGYTERPLGAFLEVVVVRQLVALEMLGGLISMCRALQEVPCRFRRREIFVILPIFGLV